MSREPTFPKDAAVGSAESQASAGRAPSPDQGKRNRKMVKGAAIGIGSAAIVAALLYANRSKRDDKKKS